VRLLAPQAFNQRAAITRSATRLTGTLDARLCAFAAELRAQGTPNCARGRHRRREVLAEVVGRGLAASDPQSCLSPSQNAYRPSA
jgi:hypothetical protein